MQIGLVGAGSMAEALVSGWEQPILVTDAGSGRAAKLADRFGGEALTSNAELAKRADVVILGHKPAQLAAVADQIRGSARGVVSLLARTSLAELREAYPDIPVIRVQPNLVVAIRRGVTVFAKTDRTIDQDLLKEVRKLFERVGHVVEVDDAVLDAAAACSAVGPAYAALIVEAQVEAAVQHGVPARIASILVNETLAGSAELLRARDYDTLGLRRSVASPGGTTVRGLAALERGGIRAAFAAAINDVLKTP